MHLHEVLDMVVTPESSRVLCGGARDRACARDVFCYHAFYQGVSRELSLSRRVASHNLVHIVTRIEKRFRSDFKAIAKRFLILDHMVKC